MSQPFPYNSLAVAKCLLEAAQAKGIALNATQTQKLLYITYGHMLSRGQTILDEQAQMWPYGPVFPKVQRGYPDLVKGAMPVGYDTAKQDIVLRTVMEVVLDQFGGNTARELSDWSHQSGSPWDRTFRQRGAKWGDTIRDEYIRDYFLNPDDY